MIRFYCDTIIRRCSLGTAFFFALNLFRGGRSQDIHQELTLLNLFLFFVSLSFSLIIRMSYNFMFSLLGFVTTNMFGLWQVNKAIVQLTSGAVIPLVFFPEAVRKVFAVLPFASLISTPLNIFLGKFSAEEILRAFALQVLWIVIITIAGNIIWKKVVKHLVIQGG
ncbi:ABC-2 family transporter protein [uncultured Treponema sp.]|uniref:ABC-2 family transporter protein n=1 Tax=uncultured Treponema sp. TaxID=162155 RepID=UPI00259627E9|nr:ABC-2 family transporter protein [uncultured Treponema sp.]